MFFLKLLSLFPFLLFFLSTRAGPIQLERRQGEVVLGLQTPTSTVTAASADVLLPPLVMAYYPDWAAASLPPENINFANFDWIDFAFAVPDQNFALTWDDPVETPILLHRLVTAAHSKGTKIKLSIGGWGGGKYVPPSIFSFFLQYTFPQVLFSSCLDNRVQANFRTQHPGRLPRVRPRRYRH